MGLIQNTGSAMLDPVVTLWNEIILALPGVILGLLVLVIGYVVGSAFGFVLRRFLEHAKLDDHVKKAGVAHSIGFISISTLSGSLLKWYVFSLFLLPVTKVMGLGSISSLLYDFALWIPHLIAAIIILLLGVIIADYIADRMLHAKRSGVKLFSSAVRWFIILFVALTALDQVGIDVSLATNTTLVLVAGLSLGIALALGIGFGFALKDEAKGIIRKVKKGF